MPATISVETPTIKFVPITPVEPGTGFNDYRTGIRNTIARRAYEIFESRGRAHGYDIDDWLQAESQVLRRIAVRLDEAEHLYTVTAEVSGFDADELEVRVEPFRVFITGAKSDASASRDDQEIFEGIDLGQEIETRTVIAELNHGRLTISMRKAHMPSIQKRVDPNRTSSKTRSAQLRQRADIAKRYADAAKDHLRRAVARERKARIPTAKGSASVLRTEETPHSLLG